MQFKVIDKNRGEVGYVSGFSGHDLQDLVIVTTSKGESFEVPFVEPIHYQSDFEKKCLYFDIPFGLLPDEEI